LPPLDGSEQMTAGAGGLAGAPHTPRLAVPARDGAGVAGTAPRQGRLLAWLLALPLLLLLALPLIALLWRGATAGEGMTPAAWAVLRQALGLSLLTSAISTVLIVVAGTPLAFLLARRRSPVLRAIDALVDLPIVLPPSVAGIALLLAFGRFGLAGQWLDRAGITLGFTTAAVVLAQTFVAAPFFIRAATGAFTRIDRDLEIAAAGLGASPWRTIRAVTMPLALPGLLAGLVLAWARALGEFGATIMFAGNFPGITRTMPLAIYSAYGAGDLETAVLLSLALLIASAGVLALVRIATGPRR
jgi:molybdate transport system permease protein